MGAGYLRSMSITDLLEGLHLDSSGILGRNLLPDFLGQGTVNDVGALDHGGGGCWALDRSSRSVIICHDEEGSTLGGALALKENPVLGERT